MRRARAEAWPRRARLERNGCSYKFVAATGMYKLESWRRAGVV